MKIIIENYTIPSYPLFIIFDIIGIAIIIEVKRLRRR